MDGSHPTPFLYLTRDEASRPLATDLGISPGQRPSLVSNKKMGVVPSGFVGRASVGPPNVLRLRRGARPRRKAAPPPTTTGRERGSCRRSPLPTLIPRN